MRLKRDFKMYYSERPQIPTVTKNLLIVNVIAFLATLVNERFMIMNFALFYPESTFFRWWQPITHMFIHGGWAHIIFNMYSLFIFGCVVERIIGSKKFFWFYMICGLGAAAFHICTGFIHGVNINTPTVGASGAIYGVLIAYAMLFPDSRLTLIFPPISLSAKSWVLIFLGIDLLTGVTGTADGVAHFAHLGGALIGWLMILQWRRRGILFDNDRL